MNSVETFENLEKDKARLGLVFEKSLEESLAKIDAFAEEANDRRKRKSCPPQGSSPWKPQREHTASLNTV